MKWNRKLGFQLAGYAIFCIIILVVPLFVDNAYVLNKYARYVVFAILSVSLSLSWGYSGILNLGQAASFGLGSYCMAMALKLRTIPIQTGAKGLPDFMVWNNVKSLPWFWEPFHSYLFAIAAGMIVPALVAAALGWFIFRGRVTGVYVSIITLATMVVINLVIIDQQSYTGGFNGITDLATLTVAGIAFDPYSLATYYLAAITLTVCLFLGLAFVNSKTGLILQAIRDDENRVWYFGYDVAAYKNLVFCISAAVAGFAGMIYTLVMEFASPTFLAVPISLSIVIWCAVGGRGSLVGAALGALVVTGVQGSLSDSPTFLDTWMLVMGALFIIVVLFLPNGLVSLIGIVGNKWRRRRPLPPQTLPVAADPPDAAQRQTVTR
jgi:urea transport system permease protein